jgi:hypothetical protein
VVTVAVLLLILVLAMLIGTAPIAAILFASVSIIRMPMFAVDMVLAHLPILVFARRTMLDRTALFLFALEFRETTLALFVPMVMVLAQLLILVLASKTILEPSAKFPFATPFLRTTPTLAPPMVLAFVPILAHVSLDTMDFVVKLMTAMV